MLRDSRIVHIIDLLGELRELLFVIDQAGDTAPPGVCHTVKTGKRKSRRNYTIDP